MSVRLSFLCLIAVLLKTGGRHLLGLKKGGGEEKREIMMSSISLEMARRVRSAVRRRVAAAAKKRPGSGTVGVFSYGAHVNFMVPFCGYEADDNG